MADDATDELVKMVANVQLRRKSVDSIELPEPSRTEGKPRREVDIGRRATVAASDFEGIAADQPTVDVRLGSLQKMIAREACIITMKKVKLLQVLSGSEVEELAALCSLETYRDGDKIVTQGEMGQTFYMLKSGKATVTRERAKVELKEGSFFNERALLGDEACSATITAAGVVECYVINREDFERHLGRLQDIVTARSSESAESAETRETREQRVGMIKKVKLLQLLGEEEVEELAAACTLVKYTAGASIISQGGTEAQEKFYMLKSGEVSVSRKGVEAVRLKEGSFFGEHALLEDDRCLKTGVTAVGAVECYVLNREDFNEHLGSLQDILRMRTAALGRARRESQFARVEAEKRIKLHELQELALLGSGAYGLVSLVKDMKHTRKTYALKSINKKYVQHMKMQMALRREVTILNQMDHPMLVRIVKTFNDASRVYMLMEPCMGGELFAHLNTEVFSEERTKFYAACVVLGIRHLHKKNVIYRDLKLENLLLNEKGYVKLIDFGFAKQLLPEAKAFTLCGTADYMAPEVIKGNGYDKGCDLWALGVLIFEMMHGYCPFAAPRNDEHLIFQQVLKGTYSFEEHCSAPARAVVTSLLHPNPELRLGNGRFGMDPLLNHPWFRGIDWDKLEKHQIKAPFIPKILAEDDIRNFDEVNGTAYAMHRRIQPVDDKMLDAVFSNDF